MSQCSGRRYPNADASHKGGCLERPPPVAFFPFTAGFTGVWSDINATFQYCPNLTRAPVGWNPASIWAKNIGVRLIEVRKFVNPMDNWSLSVEYIIPGGPFPSVQSCYYEKEFAAGFPKWPDYYEIPFVQSTEHWTYGTPSIVNLYIGNYALMPPGFCG